MHLPAARILAVPCACSPLTSYQGPGACPRRYQGTLLQVVDCFVTMTLRLCRPACSVFLTSDSEEAQTWFLGAMAARNISTAVYTGMRPVSVPYATSCRSVHNHRTCLYTCWQALESSQNGRVYTGDILHLEHNRGHAGQHLKTFADWVALGRTDLMVASRSGFADTASWYSNVPAVTLVHASPACLFASGPELPLGTDPT